jgi:methylenetetrahydrofolate dehydrogenase (NADP+) / methenyltetrahydrofolate cyclohydrolase
MIFDGVLLANKIREELKSEGNLVGKRLVIFQTGNNESRYVKLKREMGESLGVKVEVRIIDDLEKLKQAVLEVSKDSSIDGLLVQLPIAGADNKKRDEILNLIDFKKDVDGLNPDGDKFLPAVVVAVEKILLSGVQPLWEVEPQMAVVGAGGMVGKALVKRFGVGYKVIGIDIEERKSNHREGRSLCAVMMWGSKQARENLMKCDVVISATGKADLITSDMLMSGVIVIDLGYPKADFERKVSKIASFYTPVPGGVGPVTVVSLFENLSKTD